MVRMRSRVRSSLSAPKTPIYDLVDIDYLVVVTYTVGMPMSRKLRALCLACGKETARPTYRYCSNICQKEYEYQLYIQRWKAGKESGLRVGGLVGNHVKKYLRIKFGNKCVLCGWHKVNPKTGLVPLVADHVDGNWRNNAEKNLRLVCPNCDALGSTYAALNKGNGRINRAVSKRVLASRLEKRI